MPIYQYKGKSYSIDTDDPDEARRKITQYLEVNEPGATRSFGRSAASLADVGLNAVTGTLDLLAYPLARAYYGTTMDPQQAAERARQETTSPKDIIGRTLNIAQTPQYQGEAARRGTQFVGEQLQPVIESVAQSTGMPAPDVENILGTTTLAAAPGVSRAAAPVARRTMQAAEDVVGTTARVAAAPVRAGAQVAEGLFGGVTGRIAKPGETPGPLQAPSSRIPLGETYIDPLDWARFQRGEITLDQLRARPIQELAESGLFTKPALALAGREMPVTGQGARAFGEALGRQYQRNPLTGAIDIGVGALGLPPPVASYRVAQGLADYYLSGRGFDPQLPQQLQAARGQAGVDIMRQRALNQPLQIPYNPTPAQPVAPGPIYVSPEGVAGTNVNQVSQAGAQQRYAPQPVAPVAPPAATAAQIQETAAQRAQQFPVRTPEQQAILEQIRARGAAQREAALAARAQATMGTNYQPPAAAAPLAPPPTLAERRAALDQDPRQRLFENETPVAPVAPVEPTVRPFESIEERPRTGLDDANLQRMIDRNPGLARNPIYRRKGTLSMIAGTPDDTFASLTRQSTEISPGVIQTTSRLPVSERNPNGITITETRNNLGLAHGYLARRYDFGDEDILEIGESVSGFGGVPGIERSYTLESGAVTLTRVRNMNDVPGNYMYDVTVRRGDKMLSYTEQNKNTSGDQSVLKGTGIDPKTFKKDIDLLIDEFEKRIPGKNK